MNQLHKLSPSHLRVSHHSEVLQLRRALAQLQLELKEIKSAMNQPPPQNLKKITLLSNGKHYFISLEDIIYCEAEGNYSSVHVRVNNNQCESYSMRTLFVSKSLKTIGELMLSCEFIRCHQSYLVNKSHVVGYESKNGFQLKMSDGKHIPVSRRNKKLVLKAVQNKH